MSLKTCLSLSSDVAVTLVIPLTAFARSRLRDTGLGDAFGDGMAASTVSSCAKCFSCASVSVYGKHTAWMGPCGRALISSPELVLPTTTGTSELGSWRKCAMTFFACFGSRSCAFTFCTFCVWAEDEAAVIATLELFGSAADGVAKGPTMSSRTTRADSRARFSERERRILCSTYSWRAAASLAASSRGGGSVGLRSRLFRGSTRTRHENRLCARGRDSGSDAVTDAVPRSSGEETDTLSRVGTSTWSVSALDAGAASGCPACDFTDGLRGSDDSLPSSFDCTTTSFDLAAALDQSPKTILALGIAEEGMSGLDDRKTEVRARSIGKSAIAQEGYIDKTITLPLTRPGRTSWREDGQRRRGGGGDEGGAEDDRERPSQSTQSLSLSSARPRSRSRGATHLCGVELGGLCSLAINDHDVNADFFSDEHGCLSKPLSA